MKRERCKRGIKVGLVQINFSNRWLYTFITIGILMIISVGVYALAGGIDTSKGYHESTQVSVNVGGTEKTLQEAIDGGDFGGGSGLWTQSGSDIYYNDGKIGIGTDSPESKLSVGNVGDSTYAIYGYSSFGGIRGSSGYAVGVYGHSTKNIGVKGYGGSESCDFDAVGPGTNYCASSSIRWKKNIMQIDGALDKILSLEGVYFNWDEEHGGKYDMGMIAEEVGKIVPEIVVYEPDGIFASSIDYGALTPLLVEAIKEQQKQIEELKEKIKVLEN
ncbi:tail fiber domain-containing protein [Candidatus Pacearchaeota archaeon]|nr:tail fiber domain-containing protein [Candidatus Pacearchaeota archaeon]